MDIINYLSLFWFTAILVSFLNCIIYRYVTVESCHLREFIKSSHCDYCKEKINIQYILPIIGYLLSTGKCKNCSKIIPLYYLMSECILALMALYVYYKFSLYGVGFYYLVMVLISITYIDIKKNIIPLIFTIPLALSGIIFMSLKYHSMSYIYGAMCGFFLVTFTMLFVSYIRKENVIAGGDIALITSAGSWLGIVNMPMFIILTSILFIVHALPFRLRGSIYTPMGPSISLGFLLCLALHLLY
ncbi:leader peptidase (prepilin peptidase) / N-methyltransferase [Izhakiella capsodis]|uniref:Prepilin leader peptidase/N-methyltransferase n=1 Tax=Izhakiella capsodis TaxID=1367852 RepID=A0A1I4W5K2_9GAMM|nr:leader peptidase (prepilin peptidase) / N-methyltransferase [Izhakiella capsodis]